VKYLPELPRPTQCRRCRGELPPRGGKGKPRELCLNCSPARPTGATKLDLQAGPVQVVTLPEPQSSRGRALWDEMADKLPGALHRDLLTEACRLADRLDRMDGLLRGDRAAWAVLRIGERFNDDDLYEVTVIISSVVQEARQHAMALRSIVSELRMAMREAARTAKPAAEDEPGDAIDGLLGEMDELALRRGKRA
jgi:hypothetical protein